MPTRPDRLFRGLPSELPSWLQPHYVDDAGNLLVAIQSFVIESGDELVVVDCCFGEGHELPYQIPMDPDQYGQSLAAAGFTPGDVTTVVCTHLHLDHAGRNTSQRDGAWVPTYPNATYLLTADEYTSWLQSSAPNRAASETVEPLVAHDVLRLTDSDHAITDEIRLLATLVTPRGMPRFGSNPMGRWRSSAVTSSTIRSRSPTPRCRPFPMTIRQLPR